VVQKLTIPAQINQILIWQWLVILFVTTILLVVKSNWALSALLGGLACVLPNMYFARQLFTKRRIAEAGLLLRTIYVAEFIKLGLSIALMAIVLINYKGVHPITLLATYFIVHSCMWAVPLFTQTATSKTLKQTNS